MEIKERFADKLVNCDTYFESDQLVAVLDICDELGIPDMYEALKVLVKEYSVDLEFCRLNDVPHWELACKALSKAEGKGE